MGTHRTIMDGTVYEIKGGKTLIDGTSYSIKGGKTLVDSTAYEVGVGGGMCEITLTDAGSKSRAGAYVTVMGETYDTATLGSGDVILELPVGTPILCTVKKEDDTYSECRVYDYTIGYQKVLSEEGTYVHTVTKPVTISVYVFNSYGLGGYISQIIIS